MARESSTRKIRGLAHEVGADWTTERGGGVGYYRLLTKSRHQGSVESFEGCGIFIS